MLPFGFTSQEARDDLKEFGGNIPEWFSEMSLTRDGRVQKPSTRCKANGKLYDEKRRRDLVPLD